MTESSRRKSSGWDLLVEIDRLAEGGRPSQELAEHLAHSAAARRLLAERDASAVFSLLGVLPLEGALPERPVVEPKAKPRLPRTALAAAAAVLIGALALALGGARLSDNPSAFYLWGSEGAAAALVNSRPIAARDDCYQVVRHVDSPTARVIVLVPPTAEGPTVTMILDDEIDL